MTGQVTVIPAAIPKPAAYPEQKCLRVAAYCRVSTDSDEQQNSYRTQIAYYTHFIESHPEWRLVGVFADEGLSGTQTKHRPAFNRMIAQCRKGCIDRILCKSISRFARNTVDCLERIRELRSLGVSVLFEKENIDTLAVSSEFAISLYASFAQAESESLSRNITWGIEKAFKAGKVRYQLDRTLGYRKGADGSPVIVEEEAAAVREIFRLFADGHSMQQIADVMTARGVRRRCGSAVWGRAHVGSILRNEKYAGDAILQKSYTKDCLTHKRVKNTGQKPKYYVQGCHPAIVERSVYDRVQWELQKRSQGARQACAVKSRGQYRTRYALSELLVCGCCGARYRRTIWQLKAGKTAVWRCSGRLEGSRCKSSPSLREEELHRVLAASCGMETFDDAGLRQCAEQITVESKTSLKLRFRDGTETTAALSCAKNKPERSARPGVK